MYIMKGITIITYYTSVKMEPKFAIEAITHLLTLHNVG